MPDFSRKITKMTPTEKMEFKAALSKFPGIPDLSKMINAMLSPAELEAMEADFDNDLVLTLDTDVLDIDFSAAPVNLPRSTGTKEGLLSNQISSGTTPITIRVQNRVLAAMKAQASKKSVGYQTHIKRILNAASAG